MAVGAKTAISATDQARTASSGCCMGHAWMVAAGLAPPKRERQLAAIALIGFQSAIACSQDGMPWVGTKAFDTNVSGRNTMNPSCCAASGLRSSMPAQAPAQVMANANSSERPAGQHRGPGHGKRPEPVDQPRGHVAGQPDGRAWGAARHGHPEHPADQILVVVAATGKVNCRAENVTEQQDEDHRLDGHVAQLLRLAGDPPDAPDS